MIQQSPSVRDGIHTSYYTIRTGKIECVYYHYFFFILFYSNVLNADHCYRRGVKQRTMFSQTRPKTTIFPTPSTTDWFPIRFQLVLFVSFFFTCPRVDSYLRSQQLLLLLPLQRYYTRLRYFVIVHYIITSLYYGVCVRACVRVFARACSVCPTSVAGP